MWRPWVVVMVVAVGWMECHIQGPPRNYTVKSGVCKFNQELQSCRHQLKTSPSGGSCWVRKVVGKERTAVCTLQDNTQLYSAVNPPFTLTMYHHYNKIFLVGAFFISFSNLAVESIKFRFQDVARPHTQNLCRDVIVKNVPMPLRDPLLWDCPFFSFDIIDHNLHLTVLNPYKTSIEDWQVFQYLHLAHIHRRQGVPVTLQMAPFPNLTYSVSLMHCLDDDCRELSLTDHVILQGPESVHFLEEESPQKTQVFPLPGPGSYLVTTHIITTACPPCGCFISRSPKFVVRADVTWLRVLVVITGALVISLTLGVAFKYLLHVQRLTYNDNKEKNKPKVMLIYLAGSWSHFELVVKVGAYLSACSVDPLLVDIHSTRQNPFKWTSEHIHTSDRVLFLVPENLWAQSVTPIKDHWKYALSYMTGRTLNQHTNQAATVIMPFSASVPYQIAHLRQFKLLHDLTKLVIWLHGGTFMDRWFMWSSGLRWAGSEEATYSLTNLRDLLENETDEQRDEESFKMKWKLYFRQLFLGGLQDDLPQSPKLAPPLPPPPSPSQQQQQESVVEVGENTTDGQQKKLDGNTPEVQVLLNHQPGYSSDGYESSECSGSLLSHDAYL
ncbi:hypothetical protein Hamer_G020769 [Homarus americanus]|uniref:SEFIR domain-containing protein n=1 Tax=Homarus americanus TaxID=6706 RepID=A0A8J5MMC6_HOMAM|nr:hypothetical protein Hamer_G020769 [Homarus americanus]